MKFHANASVTIDVPLNQPLALLNAARNRDTERLNELLAIVDYSFNVDFE